MPITTWRLDEWNAVYSSNFRNNCSLTAKEIQEAKQFLRSNDYPSPEDCPLENCPKFRPACKVGICRIAVGMCGDFEERR